jgi:hypothetical protein
MQNDWVVIFTATKQYEVELVHGMLLENEIESIIVNKQDSSYLFGECELLVQRDDILMAKTLIQNLDL